MTPIVTFFATVVLVSLGLGLVRIVGRLRRRAAVHLLGGQALHAAVDIDAKVHLFRTPPWHGMQPGGVHRVRIDLLLGDGRFVVASDRGVLVDIGPEHGRRLSSARCTGPQRLVLEGAVPRTRGPTGRWRLEMLVPDAERWASELAAFADGDAPYGTYHEASSVS